MKIILLICILALETKAWDAEELEIFDLVEEIEMNFYEIMGINQDATTQEIKKAFRNLSIVLHPDKNNAEDANKQFRDLVSIYEVLKDQTKREKYNKVLKNGLPNWKSALYYYRRVRKVGFAEMLVILFLIFTMGQYFVAWAIYIENRYTAEQIFGSKLKRMQKKHKTNIDLDSIISDIPSPSIYNTLPFQIPRFIWNLPQIIKNTFGLISEYTQNEIERKKREAQELERQKELEKSLVREKEARKEKKENLRKRKKAKVAPEKTDEELAGYTQINNTNIHNKIPIKPVSKNKAHVTGGFWSDDDLAELVRLVKKYPSGTFDRWEVISNIMSRTVSEVTFMAAKLKENGYRIPGQTDNTTDSVLPYEIETKKIKAKKTINFISIPENIWSQEQQKALEMAIVKYPKTGTMDRWQKISNCVPEKTKEECLMRYKYLVEIVKSQKENNTIENSSNLANGELKTTDCLNQNDEVCIERNKIEAN